MNFDWKEYLKVAEYFKQMSLKKPLDGIIPSQEAIHRAGISRAYYSAFCICRNTAQKNGFPNKTEEGESIHKNLIMFYKKQNQNISRQLNNLRKWRVSSDYHEELKNSFELLNKSILLTKEIFQMLEKSGQKKTLASA